jgi:glycosyltransferase involved in cell wall biosynthesis
LKILFLSERFYPHYGGAEFATYLFAKLLSSSEHEIVVVTNRFPQESQVTKEENLTIIRLPILPSNLGSGAKYQVTLRFDILLSSFMRRLIKWADLVYIPRYWFSAIPFIKTFKKPVVTHLHDYAPICPLSNAYNSSKNEICNPRGAFCYPKCIYSFEKNKNKSQVGLMASVALNSTIGGYIGKLVRFSDAVICVSKVHRDLIVHSKPSISDKTFVVYNPLPECKNIKIEGNDFGYFGGTDCLKGFYELQKAMIHLNQKDIKFRIHSTKLASKKSVDFFTKIGIVPYGKLDRKEFLNLYKKIRGVIFPSIWNEPWPYVIVEAILNGRFVIASAIGGIPEQLEDCKGTILCEPGNYEDLANAIDLVGNMEKEEIINLGLHNKETFLKKFNTYTSFRTFIGILENLV